MLLGYKKQKAKIDPIYRIAVFVGKHWIKLNVEIFKIDTTISLIEKY